MARDDGLITISRSVSVMSVDTSIRQPPRIGPEIISDPSAPCVTPTIPQTQSTPIIRQPAGRSQPFSGSANSQLVVGDLIDFLRNKTPPPENYMSHPDDSPDSSSGGKWSSSGKWSSRFGLFRRQSTKASHKPLLRLPDSAVAGTTIDGHRHIAISIPLQYTPFTTLAPPTTDPQLLPVAPVYSAALGPFPSTTTSGTSDSTSTPILAACPRDAKDSKSLLLRGAIRTFVGNKGTVTVLRRVTEQTEPLGSPIASSDIVPKRRYGPSVALTPGSQWPASRPELSVPQRLGGPTAVSMSLRGQTDYIPSSTHPPLLGLTLPPSLDLELPPLLPVASSPHSRPTERVGDIKASSMPPVSRRDTHSSIVSTSSVAGSEATIESEPVISNARAAQAYPSAAHVMNGPLPGLIRASSTDGRLPITVITKNPLINGNRPAEIRDRRDRVRDRKWRDMRASQSPGVHADILTTEIFPTPPTSLVKSPDGSLPDRNMNIRPTGMSHHSPRSTKRPIDHYPTLTAVMVVADVKPTDIALHDLQPNGTAPIAEQVPQLPVLAPQHVATNTPPSTRLTPPQSPGSGSIAGSRNTVPLDRTSLSRRRAWSTTPRGRARPAREDGQHQSDQRDHSYATPRSTRVRPPLTGWSTSESAAVTAKNSVAAAVLPLRRDLLHGMQSLNELRIRSAERRLRRLEHDGDVWMRTLVPVLDGINQTLAVLLEDQPLSSAPPPSRARTPATRSWTDGGELDDDEVDGNATRPASTRGRTSAGKQDQILAELVQLHKAVGGRLAAASSARSGVISGLDAIEPLMRELRGAVAGGEQPPFGAFYPQSTTELDEDDEAVRGRRNRRSGHAR